MGSKNPSPNKGDEKNSALLLKQALEENALKQQLLAQTQARKIDELNKVQQEIEELKRLYTGGNRKK